MRNLTRYETKDWMVRVVLGVSVMVFALIHSPCAGLLVLVGIAMIWTDLIDAKEGKE